MTIRDQSPLHSGVNWDLEPLHIAGLPEQAISAFQILAFQSPYCARILLKYPKWCLDLIDSPPTSAPDNSKVLQALLKELVKTDNEAQVMKVLRRFHNRRKIGIYFREVTSLGSLQETTRDLSDLAEVTLQAAHDWAFSQLIKRYGVPLDEGDKPISFVILGMGKLGGSELNFSSDIDLIYFHGSEPVRFDDSGVKKKCPPARFSRTSRPLAGAEFFTRLGRLITKLISKVTEDGMVHRVDLDLRPDGERGGITRSLESLVRYYETFGSLWERSAMIKCRPVAGDIALGNEFLKAIGGFVYRAHLSFEDLEEMGALKRRYEKLVEAGEESQPETSFFDLKLGRGGIRGVEFVIQTLQLIYGGRHRLLRERSTLSALRKLVHSGHLSDREAERLTESYTVLRYLEHRLQMEENRQTQRLPMDRDGFKLVACRMAPGLPAHKAVPRLRDTLRICRESISCSFDELFKREDSSEPDSGDRKEALAERILGLLEQMLRSGIGDDKPLATALDELGFRQSTEGISHLKTLYGRPNTPLYVGHTSRLYKLHIPLLLALADGPDPDKALIHFTSFSYRLSSCPGYYKLFQSRPSALSSLINLFGSSDAFSQKLIRFPGLLDNLLQAGREVESRDIENFSEEIKERLELVSGSEGRMDSLRRFKSEEELRIGFYDSAGILATRQIHRELSDLAEAILAWVFSEAWEANVKRFGVPVGDFGDPAKLAVIGMGKLGSRDLSYGSDLDLIFVFSGSGETDGPLSISNHEFFARVVRRLLFFLSTPMSQGMLYQSDTLLRPSGSQGSLVTSFEQYKNHFQAGQFQSWERLACIRGRFVAGDHLLGRQVEEVMSRAAFDNSFCGSSSEEVFDLQREVVRLRMRQEGELACESAHAYNVKIGFGGLVDIEYLVQYLQINTVGNHQGIIIGADREQICSRDIMIALEALLSFGALGQSEMSTLKEAYLFLQKLSDRIRVVNGRSDNLFLIDKFRTRRLARRMGFRGADCGGALLRMYRSVTQNVRTLFNERLGSPISGETE